MSSFVKNEVQTSCNKGSTFLMSSFVKNEVQTFCYKGSTVFYLMSFKCLALSKTKSKPLVTKGALFNVRLYQKRSPNLFNKGSTFFTVRLCQKKSKPFVTKGALFLMSGFVKNEVQTFCNKGSTVFSNVRLCQKTKSKPLVTKGALF